MDMPDTDVTLECSRPRALMLLFAGIPLFIVMTALFAAIMVSVPFLPIKKADFQMLATVYLLFPVLVMFFAWCVWAMLRYREALFATIRVSSSGIVVQNAHYGVLALNWADVQATYSSFGKMVILQSTKLVRPLAIMSFGGGRNGPSREFLAAKAIVQRNVGKRWREQRLLL
jgi:hypothetical protein